MTLKYQRLRAPTENGKTLQVPPLAEFSESLRQNRQALNAHHFDLSGQSIDQVRDAARDEMLQLALEYSRSYRNVAVVPKPAGMLLAGHQPTLFHPGVWYKNFALNSLAMKTGFVGINLVIDNDHHAMRSIRVPTGDISDPRIELVKYDSKSSSGAFETEKVYDRDLFKSFADRIGQAVGSFVPSPLVEQLWPYAVAALEQFGQPSIAIAAARHRLEQDFGLQNLEVPLSRVCQTESFAYFAGEVIGRAHEFQTQYNKVLNDYRQLNRIRSTSHPVPELQRSEDWIELPFWIWDGSNATRRRLFVRLEPGQVTIGDRSGMERSMSLQDLPEQLYRLAADGISLRPRALLTTMYSRLVLSDAFLHGIGGAKYDQLTDQIIRRIFEVEPPTYNTVTATFHLPIDFAAFTSADIRKLECRERELLFHAERFVSPGDESLATLVRKKQRHLEAIPENGARKPWHDQMETINRELQDGVVDERAELKGALKTGREQLRVSKLLGSREFSFCLFDEELVDQLRNTV